MPEFVNGLPLHVLVIHAVVVFVPLGALGTVVIAAWPAARRRIGWVVAGVVAAGTALTPVASQSGELLQNRLPENPLIQAHAELGDQLIFFVAPQLLAVLGLMIAHTAQRTAERPDSGGNPARAKVVVLAVAVLAVGLSVAASVHVFRVGEAGSRAVWEGVANLPAR
jgi:putative Ca2+/H+ antiporter (TMEM165/GDT1 family)